MNGETEIGENIMFSLTVRFLCCITGKMMCQELV